MADYRSEDVIAAIRAETDTVFLAFSCGKDSIAAWLAIKDVFPRIIPFYRYLVPDLEFVEETLTRFERDVFGCHIWRVPHPSLYRWLNALTYQPPERCSLIEAAELPDFDYNDVNRALCEDLAIDYASTWIASGVRAVDSPLRWRHFQQHGAVSAAQRLFYPVFDWRKERLVTAIRDSGIKLPVDYRLFGRSFDGLDLRFLYPLKQHFPRDYQRILDWFPLAELEIKRHEYAQRRPARLPA